MASAELPRVATQYCFPATDDTISELEGTSPTSTEYEPLEFFSTSGQQQCRLQQHGARRRVLKWLVKKLQQHGKHELSQGQQQKPAGYLPCGGSYDSLSGFSEYSESLYDVQKMLQPGEQQHLLEQDTASSKDAFACPQDMLTNSTAEQEQHQGEGFLRRLAKAVLKPVVRFVQHICSSSGPQGPGNNDNSLAEQIINVVTSIPYFIIGMHSFRRRRCPRGRHFGLAFMAVGVVASLYHGASPCNALRPLLRKMDYYTICYTSNVMRRAAHIPLPPIAQVAAVLAAPIKPSLVTGLNLLLVESKFLQHALAYTHLRPSFNLHLGAGAVGMLAFAYEDIATLSMGWPPVLHSLWHCLSAVAMGCTSSLLSHLELALMVEGVQLEVCM